MSKGDPARLVASIVICLFPGIAGSAVTVAGVSQWYPSLAKPFFNPPSWIFTPVWTILYIMMGISLFLIWRKPISTPGRKKALYIFAVQLVLNAAWSPVFFGLRSIVGGMILITLLWLSIGLVIYIFDRISRKAALLLVPYFLWVSFASMVNFSLLILNCP
jgi:tryptophan-rich sensory protein